MYSTSRNATVFNFNANDLASDTYNQSIYYNDGNDKSICRDNYTTIVGANGSVVNTSNSRHLFATSAQESPKLSSDSNNGGILDAGNFATTLEVSPDPDRIRFLQSDQPERDNIGEGTGSNGSVSAISHIMDNQRDNQRNQSEQEE